MKAVEVGMHGFARTLKVALTLAVLLGFLGGLTAAYAQGEAPPAPGASPAGEELPSVETPSSPGAGPSGPRPALDPFKALIEPKPEPVPVTTQIPTIQASAPPPPPIPPVNFKVNAVAGDSPNFVAVIEFEGQTYIVQAGTKVPEENPAFEVKTVTSDKVEVFDRKTNRLVQRPLITE